MISCKFIGKLGNHMYQTAATIAVARQLYTDFVLPTKSHAGHYGDISPDFSGFSYPFKFEDRTYSNKFNQPTFGYTPIEIKDDMELHGFYQSYKYFDSIKYQLRTEYYKFKGTIVEEAHKKYTITPNCLGISVRRGDYIQLQHNHCVLSMRYYQDALQYIFDVDEIYIFSDDINWCKQNICLSETDTGLIFVEENAFTQMYLMTQMKNLILSNSTFAWWGGYLNNKGGKIIIPEPWFGPANDHHDVSGLYCPNWIKQKHERVIV